MFDLSGARLFYVTIGMAAYLLDDGRVVLELGWEEPTYRVASEQERLGLLHDASSRHADLHDLLPNREGQPDCEKCEGVGYLPIGEPGLSCPDCWSLGWLV